jgi:hypothetical protein
LDKAASAVGEAAGEQRQLATEIRTLARRRRRGDDIVAAEVTGVLGRLSNGASRLIEAAAHLRTGFVRQLLADGLSLREVSRRLGLSHQRLSAVLRKEDARPLQPDVR